MKKTARKSNVYLVTIEMKWVLSKPKNHFEVDGVVTEKSST